MLTEVVEAEGHLIDSQILNVMFDTVVRNDAAFEVLEFRIGRTNDEPSFVAMRISAQTEPVLHEVLEELVTLGCRLARAEDAHLVAADRDGCAPEDFYSTTNHRTFVRQGGQWLPVEGQRMDATIVIASGAPPPLARTGAVRAICRKLRDIRKGDLVVAGVKGIKIVPEFRERDRLGFAFMTNEISSERRVEVGVRRIAALMKEVKRAGDRIAFVAGPVVVHTGGGTYFRDLIRGGYVDVLLAGNAAALDRVGLVLVLSTMLHGIGVGNMLPAWVRLVCVDINPAVVTKLADRGSSQTVGIVTDVGLFLRQLASALTTD